MKNKNRIMPILSLAAAMLLAIALTIPVATAAEQKEYGLKLLAVSDSAEAGVTANLHLRTAPGTGNVFIEAEPVTKLDTRISFKLAKEIACQSMPAVSEKCDSHVSHYTGRIGLGMGTLEMRLYGTTNKELRLITATPCR